MYVLNIPYSKMCSIRGGDSGNQFTVFCVLVMPTHLVSCFLAEFFNSENAKADQSGLTV